MALGEWCSMAGEGGREGFWRGGAGEVVSGSGAAVGI